MAIKTTITKKVPSLGAVYQTAKADPRIYDTLHGLDKRIKSLVNLSIAQALAQPGVLGETLFLGYFVNAGIVLVSSVPQNYVSPIDSYQYAQDEVQYYSWNFVTSRLPLAPFVNGQLTKPTRVPTGTGGGDILWWDSDIDQTTGVVFVAVGYYVQGGAETPTNDGVLEVYASVRRKNFPV